MPLNYKFTSMAVLVSVIGACALATPAAADGLLISQNSGSDRQSNSVQHGGSDDGSFSEGSLVRRKRSSDAVVPADAAPHGAGEQGSSNANATSSGPRRGFRGGDSDSRSERGMHGGGFNSFSAPGFGKRPLDLTLLNLSEAQKQKIQHLHGSNGARVREMRKALMSKRAELRDMMFDSAASDDQIKGKHRELMDMQRQVEETQIADFLAVRACLTPEQRLKLSDLKPGPQFAGANVSGTISGVNKDANSNGAANGGAANGGAANGNSQTGSTTASNDGTSDLSRPAHPKD